MINIVIGERGLGKTKKLVSIANDVVEKSSGITVFIDNGTKLIYDIHHNIKLIDINQYNIINIDRLYGFICGIHANNYDTTNIILDYKFNLNKENMKDLYDFLLKLYYFSDKTKINFWISLSLNNNEISDQIKNLVKIV